MKKKNKILIVDDAKALAENLGDTLSMEGYTVSVLNDGISALSFLEKETPDIIITDLIMPNMNGFELMQEIKKIKRLNHTKLIAVSADLDEDRIKKGTSAGADLFFSKPFDEEALLTALHKLANG
ncbi:MAG TPA: response regulator [Cyclobacteriaceae bacterium]|jgi:CheY-like chemotaxis protein|nr:response regulator [Cyclobacteriaceae bacterium]